MTQTISLSIIIPTHRRPRLLARAVESALATSDPRVEVVVVADRDKDAATALARWSDDRRLRLVNSDGPGGAADTRNRGVAAARGAVILFLDDDDELIGGYPDRVLAIIGPAAWGFARTMRRANDDAQPERVSPKGWAGGMRGYAVPFRRKLAGLGAGFWVQRDLFMALGGLCVEQTLDEDTDLCCRLLAAGHQPWFDPAPAVIVDRVASVVRLTSDTDRETRAECYLRTFLRNGNALGQERGARTHLAFRAQRMIIRSGRSDLLAVLYDGVPELRLRLLLRAKRMITGFSGARVGANPPPLQ